MGSLGAIGGRIKVLIIRLDHVPVMDATGLVALESAIATLSKHGCATVLTGLQAQPRRIDRAGRFFDAAVEGHRPTRSRRRPRRRAWARVMAPARRSNRGSILVLVLVGAVLGMAGFTFLYAEGLSYFSTEPQACANCHIMNDQYASWPRGRTTATPRCVDCHLPHDFVAKYLAKAENGYHHSKGFTLQDFHEPILIKPQQRRDPAGELPALPRRLRPRHRWRGSTTASKTPCRCVHCHRGAGHGARG